MEKRTFRQKSKGMDILQFKMEIFLVLQELGGTVQVLNLLFDKNGLVRDKSKISTEHAKEINHYLKANSVSKDGGAGAAIAFYPAGTPYNNVCHPSTDNVLYRPHLISHKTALWFGQQLINGSTEDFFYKVE